MEKSFYELVVVLNPTMSSTQIDEFKSEITNIFWEWILQIDEIWMLDMQIKIKWFNNAYYISYYLWIDKSNILEYKKQIWFLKNVFRFFFYKMKDWDKFLIFKDVSKMFEMTDDERFKQKSESAFHNVNI